MTTHHSAPLEDSTHDRRRRRKALLAGGIVLGLGAAMTLAAWSDDVFVNGSFAAGQFGIEGAVDNAGTAWQQYDSSPGGGLAFTLNPQTMAPGDAVYAPLNLRVDQAKNSYDATITLPTAPTGPATASTANSALFNALRVSLYNVPPAQCNANGTTGTAMSGFDGVALSTTTTTTMLTLDKADTVGKGICFKVSLPTDAPASVQGGQTGSLVWQFHGESA